MSTPAPRALPCSSTSAGLEQLLAPADLIPARPLVPARRPVSAMHLVPGDAPPCAKGTGARRDIVRAPIALRAQESLPRSRSTNLMNACPRPRLTTRTGVDTRGRLLLSLLRGA